MQKYLQEYKFSSIWDKYQKVQLLYLRVSAYLVFRETTKLFSSVALIFYIPTNSSIL